MFSSRVAMAGSSSQKRIDTSIERLSAGKRINSAKDDVAGLAISTRLNAEIMGLNQASRNAADTQSILDAAEVELQEIHSLLLRRKELIIQSANGTLASSDRSAVDQELSNIKEAIKSISLNNSWGGQKLLDGNFSEKEIQIGSYATDKLTVSIENADYFSGSEFKVNTNVTGNQSYPSSSALSDGGFLVVWESGTDIYAQRYSSNEASVGSEFRVNTYTSGLQSGAETVGLSNGGFVVTWISDGQDGSGQGIYGQIYDAAGSALGSEFRVNTHTSNHQTTPKIARLFDGGFVVTWSSRDQDGSDQGIFGQRYSASGSTVGSEFQINTHTARNQSLPSISSLQNGGFVVTWVSDQQEGLGLSDGLYGQIFDSTVNRVGSEFQINTTTLGSQTAPSVVGLNNGDFVVSWHYNTSAYGDYNIGAQRFDGSGTKIGSEIEVNTYTTAEQYFPSIASLEDGGFLISWQSKNQDGSDWGVYAQQFDSLASKVGSEFKINESTNSWQLRPRLTTLSHGSVVAAWHSNHDGNEEIYAKVVIRGTDNQIAKVSESRAKLGSLNNRLDVVVSNNLKYSINLERANGQIRDTDFALETAELAKNNILQQTSIQMEVIAKKSTESLTRLLNGDSFVHKKSFLY